LIHTAIFTISSFQSVIRLLKNGHLLRFPHPSLLQRTSQYASLLRISGALHLALFEQPGKDYIFNSLLSTHGGKFPLMNKWQYNFFLVFRKGCPKDTLRVDRIFCLVIWGEKLFWVTINLQNEK